MAEGIWSIEPKNEGATINEQTGEVTFSNRSSETGSKTYTIKYEENGYCGSTGITQPGGSQPTPGECGFGYTPCRDCLNAGGNYLTFIVKNNSGSQITINAGVKIKMYKEKGSIPDYYYASFDLNKPKVSGVYPTLTINNGDTETILYNELVYVLKSTIADTVYDPNDYTCIGETADFMDGQSIFAAYVYNTNTGEDVSCSISPTTYYAGGPDDIKTYTVTIG